MNKSDIRKFLSGMTVEDEIESILREVNDVNELTLGTDEYEEYIEELIGRLKNVKKSVRSRTNQGKMFRKEADRLQSAITSLRYLNNRSQRVKNKYSKDLLDESVYSNDDVRQFLYNMNRTENELLNERVKMSGEFAFAREGGCEFDMTRLNFPIAKQLTSPKTQKALSNIGRMLAVPKPFCDLLNLSSRALGIFFGEEGDSNIEGEKIEDRSDATNSEIESELKGLHLRKVFEDAVSETRDANSYNSDYSDYFNHFLPLTSKNLKQNLFNADSVLTELKKLKRGLADIKTYANTNPSNVEMLMKINKVLKLEKSSKYKKLLKAIRKISEKQNDVGMPTQQKEFVKAGYNFQMTKLIFKILDDDFEDKLTEDIIQLESQPSFSGVQSKIERYLQGIKEEISVVVS